MFDNALVKVSEKSMKNESKNYVMSIKMKGRNCK